MQVSPPNEHLAPTADQGGGANNDFPWWVRYQPVTHDTGKFTSRSGTWTEFTSMVNAWIDAWTPKPKAKPKPARKRKSS